MTLDDPELAEVMAGERALMDPSVRSAPDAAGRLLASDAREFGSSGAAYDRDALLTLLAAEEPFELPEMTDVDTLRLAPDVILLTYRAVRPGRATLCSSIWRRDPEGWRLVSTRARRSLADPGLARRGPDGRAPEEADHVRRTVASQGAASALMAWWRSVQRSSGWAAA